LEVVVGGWFCSGCCWLVWKWLLMVGLEVVVVGWFGIGCWWMVWKWLLLAGLEVVASKPATYYNF
jgi:hypothetical protein